MVNSDPYGTLHDAPASSSGVPAVEIDVPEPASGNKSKKGLMGALLMTSEGPAESSAAVTAGTVVNRAEEGGSSATAAMNPSDRWWGQRRVVTVMLADAGIFFILSLITLAIWNIVVSAIGLFAGCSYYVFWFLRFRAERAIKGFYWPGIIVGVAGTVSAVKDVVLTILKIVDSPVGGSVALPFRLIFIVLNGVMGVCALWVWVVGIRCKKQIEEQAAAAAAAGGARGMLHRASTWVADQRTKLIGQGAKAAVTKSLSMKTPVPAV